MFGLCLYIYLMRRKYIALGSAIIFILCFILNIFLKKETTSFSSEQYFEYSILVLQIILTRFVYISKKHDIKNILTAANVLITISYMLILFSPILMR